MLVITIDEQELYDENTETFIVVRPTTVKLEHSLISVSKWESIHEKPFIPSHRDDVKTQAENVSYIECMVIGDISREILSILVSNYISDIFDYISAPSTATKINKKPGGKQSREYISSELIYYWMIAYSIPWEAQKWHFNRLLTLIEICNIKQQPPKKATTKSKADMARARHELNKRRREELGTRG